MSLFENVVRLNDGIEDEAKRVENLVRGIFAGNIFDLGSAQVCHDLKRKICEIKKNAVSSSDLTIDC